MMSALRAALLVLACSGCYHTVTVFVPARDVPPNTVVVAAVKAGVVNDFEPGAKVTRDGDIIHRGEVVGHVANDDLLVIEASGGEDFGRTHVSRVSGYDVATGLGICIASWVFGGVCAAEASNSVLFVAAGGICIDFAFLGSAVAALIGGPLIAFGTHGELRVDEPIRRVIVAPNGLILRF